MQANSLGKSNLPYIFFVLAALLLVALVRKDAIPAISPLQYVSIFSLAVSVIVLPDFLLNTVKISKTWGLNQGVYLVGVLVLFGVVGLLNVWGLHFVLIGASMFLLYWELSRKVLWDWFDILGGAMLFFLVLVTLYSETEAAGHSLLCVERVILGQQHVDNLFLSSIGNMLSNYGVPSTGLDGAPYLHYHWASMALVAGMAQWVNLSVFIFYNVVFPLILIPLFFKAMSGFIQSLSSLFNKPNPSELFIFAVFALLYSLLAYGFKYGQPVSSESFGLSIVFMLCLFSALIDLQVNGIKINIGHILGAICFVTLVWFTKISTGFLVSAALFYLSIRNFKWSLRHKMALWCGLVSIGVMAYFWVLLKGRIAMPAQLIERYFSFWYGSDSFLTYLFGAFFLIIYWVVNWEPQMLKKIVQFPSNQIILVFEVLFVVTGLGFAAAIAVSSNSADSFYFGSIQLYPAIALMVVLIYAAIEKLTIRKAHQKILLIAIIGLSIVSRPDLFKYNDGALYVLSLKKQMQSLTPEQQLMKELISAFDSDEFKQGDKSKTCVYIPQTELWYYNAYTQNNYPIATPFIVPAVSGVCLVQGVPDWIKELNTANYGFNIYPAQIPYPADYKEYARQKGFETVVVFRVVNGKLIKETVRV